MIVDLARRTARRLLDVPVFLKTLGIGAAVASIFGVLTLYFVSKGLRNSVDSLLEDRALSRAHALADALAEPLAVGDLFRVRRLIDDARRGSPDVRYVLLIDRQGQPVEHTFAGQVPADLLTGAAVSMPGTPRVEKLLSREGSIFDASHSIASGELGQVRVGLSDAGLRGGLTLLASSLLAGLALSAAAGVALALLLAHLITRPLQELVEAAHDVGHGDFSARAPVRSSDEVGRLAVALNEMAGELQVYRREVEARGAERTRLLDRLVCAQEDERRSLARELHDEFGQSLLALLLTIESTKASGNLATAGADMERRVRGLIDEAHRLAWGMRPSILDDYGLEAALQRYAQETQSRTGITIDYAWNGRPESERLPSRVEVWLYRIAQEALTNVVRHSGAQRASVVVLHGRDAVTLLVEDDGHGFDPAAVHSPDQHLGLAGMRERAALLGGVCAISSAPGAGTTVRVQLPNQEAATCRSDS